MSSKEAEQVPPIGPMQPQSLHSFPQEAIVFANLELGSKSTSKLMAVLSNIQNACSLDWTQETPTCPIRWGRSASTSS